MAARFSLFKMLFFSLGVSFSFLLQTRQKEVLPRKKA